MKTFILQKNILLLIIGLLSNSPLAFGDINHFENKNFTLKFFIDGPGLNLDFNSKLTNRLVRWKPNLRANIGLGISLRDYIGISGSLKASMSETELHEKGSTDYQDWRFFYNFRRVQILLNYQEYRGFYIENSGQIDSSYMNSSMTIQEPAMSARNYSANMTYIFSPDEFSLQASLDQTARQEASGGSYLVGVAANHTIFNNDNLLIPANVQGEFGTDKAITSGTFTTLSFKAGYGYTWVVPWKKLFMSGVLMVGAGFQNSRYSDPKKQYTTTRPVGKGDITVSAGYNGDKNFTGVSIIGDSTSYDTEAIKITSTLYLISFYVGTRF
jgi:hypothetical protein